MLEPYRCLVSRAACKRCKKPNDREFEGSLGGLFCTACISERRRATVREWRSRRRREILAHGGKVCRCGRRERIDGDRLCVRCRDKLPAKSLSGVAAKFLGGEPCKRCFLRGPHECLTGLETRRSSWANMER